MIRSRTLGTLRYCFLLVTSFLLPVTGAEPLAPAAPLISLPSTTADIGGWRLKLTNADRALEMGLSPVAATGYRALLASPDLPPTERNNVVLSLTSSLLEQSLVSEAQEALKLYVGTPNSRWQLRTGLIAVQQKRYEVLRALLPTIKGDELLASERGWYFFMQGILTDFSGDNARANQYYSQAFSAAVSDQQRARFEIARSQSKLLIGQVSEQNLVEQKGNVERFQGTAAGHAFAKTYAVALFQLNHKAEAINQLQRQLRMLSSNEKAVADDFRLLLGFIAGTENPAGRTALEQLLDNAVSRETQRIALQMLARGSQQGPVRETFLKKLSDLIGAPTQHPILEDLLIVRAQLALTGRSSAAELAQAESDAADLLQRFPNSPLKSSALGILVSVTWEERRYRSATDFITRLRAETAPGAEHAEFGVLLAEAYFRVPDYKNAAETYASVLGERPPGVAPGDLIFQRVVSEIRADRVDQTETLIDELALKEPEFDSQNRWRSEWNLAQALQTKGVSGTAAAYKRVTKLIGDWSSKLNGLPPNVPADLFFRMEWLQARLAFDSGDTGGSLKLVDQLSSRLNDPTAANLAPGLRTALQSNGLLLKVQAFFAQDDEANAKQLIARLNVEYKQTDAAVYARMLQANYYSSKNQLVEAEQLLQEVADEDKAHKDPNAAYALFEAALCAERRGSDQYYREAYNLLERIWKDYHSSDLVFYSRLRQGDLLRQMNNFSNAQVLYNELETSFKTHPDLLLAQMATAACHFAQASDPTHFESAAVIWERIRDLPTAPLDMRVEAGHAYGFAYSKRGEFDKATTALWAVVNAFLKDDKTASQLGATGRYWMSRSLLELSRILEQQGKNDYAREAYQLILKVNLPGAALARERLANSPAEEVKP